MRGGLESGLLAFAFPILDNEGFGDSVVTLTLGALPVPCPGDCDEDGTVAIDELVRAVRSALGNTSPEQCPAADLDADGTVRIAELIAAVNAALRGCA